MGGKKKIDWCGSMNGNSNNYPTRIYIGLLKKLTPQYVHKCPYSGVMIFDKFRILRAYVIMSENGQQRKICNLTNGKDVILTYEELVEYF